MRFVETDVRRRRRRARPARRRARVLRARLGPGRARCRGTQPAPRPGEHLALDQGGNACAACTSSAAARGGEARPLRSRCDLRRRGRPAARLATRTSAGTASVDDENGRALYVPEGCAHGFQTLVDDSTCSTDLAPVRPGGIHGRPLGRPRLRDRVARDVRAYDRRAGSFVARLHLAGG